MNKITTIIIIVVLLIIALIAVYFFRGEEREIATGPEEQEGAAEEEKSILDTVLADSETEEIDLEAVDESNSSGKAYRLFKEGVLYHAVVANIPDLEGNNKYEGWLVQPNPLKFFSTGIMEKDDQGNWILEFKSSQPLPEYYRVAITLETTVDPISEIHIIEGDFSQGIEFGQELEFKQELVEIKQFLFSPSKLIVKKGTKITWTNKDSAPHTATSNNGVFDSGLLSQGNSFSYTFNEVGTYDYFCRPHPWMIGQIIVEE